MLESAYLMHTTPTLNDNRCSAPRCPGATQTAKEADQGLWINIYCFLIFNSG
eukprot:SAG11_NODE_30733_length_298_cov_0.773869_1_plen_51_part_10